MLSGDGTGGPHPPPSRPGCSNRLHLPPRCCFGVGCWLDASCMGATAEATCSRCMQNSVQCHRLPPSPQRRPRLCSPGGRRQVLLELSRTVCHQSRRLTRDVTRAASTAKHGALKADCRLPVWDACVPFFTVSSPQLQHPHTATALRQPARSSSLLKGPVPPHCLRVCSADGVPSSPQPKTTSAHLRLVFRHQASKVCDSGCRAAMGAITCNSNGGLY